MPLLLLVSGGVTTQEGGARYCFEATRIGLRSESRTPHLLLSPTANMVDAAHAVIERHENGYRVVRPGSTPRVRLNDALLPVGTPRPLDRGDVIRLGRFRVVLRSSREAAAETDPSAVTPSFPAVADRLVDTLAALVETYEQADPDDRAAALADAFSRGHRPVSAHEAVRHVRSLLGEGKAPASGSKEDGTRERVGQGSVEGRPQSPREEALDTFAAALARILQVPDRFRSEFIGHDLAYPSDAQFLYEGDGQAIKRHVLDPALPEAERDTRLRYVEEAAASVAEHHVAMLDAYKQSIIQGIDELLHRLDPDVHREAMRDEHAFLSSLPVVGRLLMLRRIQAAWEALPSTDWDVAEQRLFRPAFTKAYLARVTVPHAPEEEAQDHHSHR